MRGRDPETGEFYSPSRTQQRIEALEIRSLAEKLPRCTSTGCGQIAHFNDLIALDQGVELAGNLFLDATAAIVFDKQLVAACRGVTQRRDPFAVTTAYAEQDLGKMLHAGTVVFLENRADKRFHGGALGMLRAKDYKIFS